MSFIRVVTKQCTNSIRVEHNVRLNHETSITCTLSLYLFRPYRVGSLVDATTDCRYNRTTDGFVDGDEQDKNMEWFN